jgi:sporulation integral membrane protein YtvI
MFYIPFLIAFVISLIIEPIIRKIMKITNFTRKASAIIVLICAFLLIIGLLAWGITTLITESSTILRNLNNNIENISKTIFSFLDNLKFDNIKIPEEFKIIIENSFSNLLGQGRSFLQNVFTSILNGMTHIPKVMIYIGITIVATYFVCTDKMYILDQMEHHLPRNWINKFGKKLRKVISSLGSYIKAECILILISFFIILISLTIFNFLGLNVTYPLVIALIIGIIDALPILGAGTVIVPWAIISAFNGDIKLSICLICLYVLIIVVRQILEPRIVSNQIGVHPIFTLIAMYTGFKIIGVIGIFVGPIILIILKNVFETMIDNGIIKTILDRK